MKFLLRLIDAGIFVATIAVLVLGIVYVTVINTTNRTDFDFKVYGYFFFIGTAVYGKFRFLTGYHHKTVSWALIGISLAGVLGVFACNYFNIMLYFNDWLWKGMPPKPF